MVESAHVLARAGMCWHVLGFVGLDAYSSLPLIRGTSSSSASSKATSLAKLRKCACKERLQNLSLAPCFPTLLDVQQLPRRFGSLPSLTNEFRTAAPRLGVHHKHTGLPEEVSHTTSCRTAACVSLTDLFTGRLCSLRRCSLKFLMLLLLAGSC